jgi:Pentapeptide repeats (8 copies)
MIIDVEQAKKQTHWTAKQRNHLRRCIRKGYTFAYYNTDRHGYPANGGTCPDWREPARPGKVETLQCNLTPCGPGALHATYSPHRWAGVRVWVVAFKGEIWNDNDCKIAGTHREIIGEVLPTEALDPSVGVRIGRKDLTYAILRNADLRYANLTSAILTYAILRNANLTSAILTYAILRNADLGNADLTYAILRNADLTYADLRYANLTSADLRNADLTYAIRNAYDAPISGWKVVNGNLQADQRNGMRQMRERDK